MYTTYVVGTISVYHAVRTVCIGMDKPSYGDLSDTHLQKARKHDVFGEPLIACFYIRDV